MPEMLKKKGLYHEAQPLVKRNPDLDDRDPIVGTPYIVGFDGLLYKVFRKPGDPILNDRTLVSFETPAVKKGRWRWAYNVRRLAKKK
jgi:hypothetical protein